MTAKTRGSLASYQWLLPIKRHLVVIFIKYMSRNYKRIATFWQKSVAITCGVTHVKNELTLTAALFWVITRRVVVIFYRRFGTTYRSRLHGSILHT
jgi:hypothetical protein